MSFIKSTDIKSVERFATTIKPTGVVPVALIRKIVDGVFNGNGAPDDGKKEWRDDLGNVVVQISGKSSRELLSGGTQEYRYRGLNFDGLLEGWERKYGWSLAMAIWLMYELDDGVGARPNEPRWWECVTGGGNQIYIVHELEGGGEGRFRYWFNPDD